MKINLSILANILVLISVFIRAETFEASTKNGKFKSLTISDGLSQNSVYTMTQDKEGFIWVGTEEGLNRYDGLEFISFFPNLDNEWSISDNTINHIFEDSKNNLWIATYGGLNRYDKELNRFHPYLHDSSDPRSIGSNYVFKIIEDTHGNMWFGTDGGGISRYDHTNDSFINFQFDSTNSSSISNNHVYELFLDDSGILWAGTTNGISRWDHESGQFTRFLYFPDDPEGISYNYINSIIQDRYGQFWVGTYGGGLLKFNPEDGTFIQFLNDSSDNTSISNNFINCIFEDRFGSIWVGTDKGLNVMIEDSGRFRRFNHDILDPFSIGNNLILTIFEDRGGSLWIGTDGGGISRVDYSNKKFAHIRNAKDTPNVLTDNSVFSVDESMDGKIWIGTYNGLNHYDMVKKESDHYLYTFSDSTTISDNTIWSIEHDHEGRTWIGTADGLNLFNPTEKTFSRFYVDPHSIYYGGVNAFHALLAISDGSILAGTSEGLFSFDPENHTFSPVDIYNEDNGSELGYYSITTIVEDSAGNIWVGTDDNGLIQIEKDQKNIAYYHTENGLITNDITHLLIDSEERLWVGTHGYGFGQFDLEKGGVDTYRRKDGLPNDVVYGIIEDNDGFLWLSTNRGLSKFDVSTGQFYNYDSNDGVQSDEFNINSCVILRDGKAVFGGINGINIFEPRSIINNEFIPPVVLTDVKIMNSDVDVGPGNRLEKTINNIELLELFHQDFIVTFRFAILNYTLPEKNKAAYILEGFDENWIQLGQNRTVTYTSLPPGDYVFRIKGSNNDNIWNETGHSIRLKVHPPFWGTVWFRLLMVFGITLAVFGTIRIQTRKSEKRNLQLEKINLTLEREIQERKHAQKAKDTALEEVRLSEQIKTNFVANVSHELRTPLASILGYSGTILRDKNMDEKVKKKFIKVIFNESQRLTRLIENILDISRIESGEVSLSFQATELKSLLKEVVDTQVILAKKKKLKIETEIDETIPLAVVSPDGIKQLLINLIGNAIKFTDEGGKIMISLKCNANELEFKIRDTGLGIPQKDVEKIFNKFYRVQRKGREDSGTGIGLAIVKEVIRHHKGQIKVSSTEGHGTEFIVLIPLIEPEQ